MRPLLIVGASGRAAAASMIRRGFTPTVIDLFADTDTQLIAASHKCASFLQGYLKYGAALAPMPWMYTGGMENHADVVDAISQRHELLGNNGRVIKAVRDPFHLADVVRRFGSRFPNSLAHSCPTDSQELWLQKKRYSAGGLGITIDDRGPLNEGVYRQRCIKGTPISAAFEGALLHGTSEQLCGTDWLHAQPFHYSGNLRHRRHPHQREFARLGRRLAMTFGLVGPWGLDAIDAGGELWILEINPRYTASMELFEIDPAAKAIYYAPQPMTFPGIAGNRFADIPAAGTLIEAGQPVLTIFGDSLLQLKETAAELDHLFGVA